jgi:two-component system sensor histidine kinase KdpD
MRPVRGALFGLAAVAATTVVVYALRPVAPVLSLGALYVFPVLAVSIRFGAAYAVPVAVASQLVFNFLFLPPLHTLALRDSENWVALAVNVVTAVVVSQLAARLIAAERVRRSDEIKTAVLRSVSHDLRSPLTAIRAAGDGLAAGGLDDGERRDLAETVRTETQRLDRLVSDLLDLSRLEAGAAEPHQELWPPDMLAADALEAVGAEAARVAVVLPDDVPPVLVDSAQAGRVLANLLDNALKFTPQPWAVELTAAREDGMVVFRVSDHGPGIAEAERERVFEPFERGQAAGGRPGSGLGLAIARGFADANGWRLWIEHADRGGATFALALPAEERAR